MFNTVPVKKDDMTLAIKVDPLKIARGHITYPKAGTHKDKRRLSRVASRVNFRRKIDRG